MDFCNFCKIFKATHKNKEAICTIWLGLSANLSRMHFSPSFEMCLNGIEMCFLYRLSQAVVQSHSRYNILVQKILETSLSKSSYQKSLCFFWKTFTQAVIMNSRNGLSVQSVFWQTMEQTYGTWIFLITRVTRWLMASEKTNHQTGHLI